ncbi:Transcriptional regulator containing PAS, AAA-type ATPase, and DNA-binding Fis domains [Peptoclostridium litorale DSM 5388]|uniref:Signal-transduction and transcriptional-control protein Stc n=1 Tax=Peptoclostridium litorale DSM 5388 TaxID=1121324 RepID=A0A069RKQ2_PEPLI|nr:sigma-54-dependent Fis family transcriptional regulator [Peptoclostridium litorale]KDR96705.1 signal-transduction and transcriptional-control protein Stc [Peptoclostridium litorale DSM 5388]SIN67563.1 Transcriptional regulator containing PAS, AAA-type ATPase, and DNA-binding Fis domains [Peptoclostridium litorale DSM 5388]
MNRFDFYSRFFSNEHSSYENGSIELLRDCFHFAVENACAKESLEKGLVVISNEDGCVIFAYDFEINSFAHGYEGRVISDGIYENADIHVESKNLSLDHDRYVVYMITGKNEHGSIDVLLENISNMIEGCANISKKHSSYGDMVLRALDNVNDAISYCDKNGYVRYANKACFEILETNREELFGHNLVELTSGKPMLLEVLKNKKSIIDVDYFVKYNDKKFHFINSGYPVYSDEGDVIGAIDIFRSIERSRKLANDIAGYRAFFTFDNIIGKSKKIVELIDHAKLFAKSNETVLVLGESGTGKELVAQAIHNYSDRKEGPFIALNCANFPNELIDSELFGYEEGAFTGAKKGGKQGKFELASGGTLFLDEIGEMQIHLQAKLLRVLETMCIARIGGNNQVKIDVRIIAATNRSLEKLVEEGTFRRDLYYRLKVLCLETPSLRERGEDVIFLAEYFMRKIADKSGKGLMIITDSAKKALLEYNWPGNVRELENLISRAVFICKGDELTEKILFKAGIKGSRYDEIIKKDSIKINREILVEIMSEMNGNKKRVAETIGISRPTLYKMLKKYNID